MTMRSILAASVLTAASLLAGGAGSAPAALQSGPSFDCAKAATAVEKAICASPALAALDRDMAVQYATAAAKTPTPVTLKAQQRDFLASRGEGDDGRPAKAIDVSRLTALYQARIETLREEIDRAKRAQAVALPQTALKSRCAVVAVKTCVVTESGAVAGSAPYGGLVYQIQEASNREDDYRRGVVVLKPQGGTLKVVLWNFEGEHPDAPSIVQTTDGPLLVTPSIHDGTGHFNADLVFRPVAGGWRDLDIDAWRVAFDKGLPAGLGVWKGVGYDWKTLTIQTYLWKDDDANCCPTGGSAEAKLTIQGDRLALKTMTFDRKPPME